jgi:hypothetical protein
MFGTLTCYKNQRYETLDAHWPIWSVYANFATGYIV